MDDTDEQSPVDHLSVDPDLSGYENIVGTCTKCGGRLVVNRATDLAWQYPAVGKIVACSRCGARLRIGGDNANHPVDQFRYDADLSFLDRRYMQCVITLSQSMELALRMCAVAWILGTVCETAPKQDVQQYTAKLVAAVRRLTLGQLRLLLVNLALNARPASIMEVRNTLSKLGQLHRRTPTEHEIAQIANEKLRNLVQALNATAFIRLRNAVVHDSYRPTEEEADACRHDVEVLNTRAMTVFGVTPRGGQLIAVPGAG